ADGGWRVADARGVVDVVRAEVARGLLPGVVRLVREPARGEVQRDPLRRRATDVRRGHVERLVPRDAAEARLAVAPSQRVSETAERAELRGAARQGAHVGKDALIDCRG